MSCKKETHSSVVTDSVSQNPTSDRIPPVSIFVLGTIQDGGSPHIGCQKACCSALFDHPDADRQVVALGVYDQENNKRFLFEATPDASRQIKKLKEYGLPTTREMPDAIFLTHAHIGHYAGLMYLGKEARDADHVTVYAMPRMKNFLETNGPWSQLVLRENITIESLQQKQEIQVTPKLSVTPFQVPHRDEYSETVGYIIQGPHKKALFIPDIDKWERWEESITEYITTVDYAFLDATFYSGEELNTRDISQIPHPFISESMEKFKELPAEERRKIIFIHFNHTNPVINPNSPEAREVQKLGFRIARIHEIFEL